MKDHGLIYYPDDQPGIQRRKRGRGFAYFAPDGTNIDDAVERKRLAALAVPPAYRDVWMCPLSQGHLQATGRDDKDRKQYRYHPDWTAAQAQTKFDKLVDFGHQLPGIRRKVRRDLTYDVGEKAFALASAVAMIDRLALRVGNKAYTRKNGSYGALTLRNRHVKMTGNMIALRYTAKGGRRVRRQLADRTLARVLNKIGDLPGASLLSWIDDDGQPQTLGSQTLNRYIADAAGDDDTTAKTFRTWAGTLAAYEIAETGPSTIKAMSEAAAKRLHNTATIARNSYIHPDIIELAGQDINPPKSIKHSDLRVVEQRMLGYLENN